MSRDQKVGLQDWDCTCPEFPEHGPHEESCSRCGTLRPPLPATAPQPSAGEPVDATANDSAILDRLLVRCKFYFDGVRVRTHEQLTVALDNFTAANIAPEVHALASRPAQPATGTVDLVAARRTVRWFVEKKRDNYIVFGKNKDESRVANDAWTDAFIKALWAIDAAFDSLAAYPLVAAASPAGEGTRACAECGHGNAHERADCEACNTTLSAPMSAREGTAELATAMLEKMDEWHAVYAAMNTLCREASGQEERSHSAILIFDNAMEKFAGRIYSLRPGAAS